MRTLLPLVTLVLLCVACGSDKPDLSKPAVIGFPTPMFDGLIAATTGDVMKTLSPQTLVYVQNATIKVNDLEYVKIFWNDTTGYVPTNWLLHGGTLGVVDCTESNPIIIYDDEALTTPSGKTLSEPQVIACKELQGGVSKIVYMFEKDGARPWFGYFKHPITTDSMTVASFSMSGAPAATDNGASAATAGGHTEMEWTNMSGTKVTGDDIPGEFALHYIWSDNTESDGNHLGDELEQGIPQCDQTHDAMAYKMLFTPNRKMNVTFICRIPMITDAEGPMTMAFTDVEAGQTVEFLITHRVYGVVCDETTFTVQTNLGLMGEGMVHAGCGD